MRETKLEKVIYLAGGCFWGTQRYFDCLAGVLRTEVGYANGATENPTYEQVKHEHTGHAETVKVVYDAKVLPLSNFYTAEEYHQKYLDKNPGGYCHIPLELFAAAKKFKSKN